MKTILSRVLSPTPKFFRKVRNVALTAGTIGAAIIAAPVALPAAIVTVAGYAVAAGAAAAAVAQATKKNEEL